MRQRKIVGMSRSLEEKLEHQMVKLPDCNKLKFHLTSIMLIYLLSEVLPSQLGELAS